jgi:hypothetical protein
MCVVFSVFLQLYVVHTAMKCSNRHTATLSHSTSILLLYFLGNKARSKFILTDDIFTWTCKLF